MNCDIIKDLLPSYIDQLTSEESDHAIQEHLKTCETCKEYYMQMKKEVHKEKESPADNFDPFIKIRKNTAKKIRRAVLVTTIAYYILSVISSFPVANKVVTKTYMADGHDLEMMLGWEIQAATNQDDIDMFIRNVPAYENSFSHPVCVILLDEEGNIIAETATEKTSEQYVKCKEAALSGENHKTGPIEVLLTADKMVYVSSFECGGERYILSAYSQIDQVAETLASEYFLFSLLVLTGALFVLMAIYMIIGKKYIR